MCKLYLFLIVFTVTLNASGSIKRNNYNNNKNNDRRCRLLITKKARRGTKKQKVCIGRTTTLHVLHPGGRGGGGEYSGSGLTGMIERFRGFFG